jgi:hypothetical protein
MRCLLPRLFAIFLPCVAWGDVEAPIELDQAPHDYWKRPLRDPFTRFRAEWEAGRVRLDESSEKAFLGDFLRVLGVPASSQMLVFSTTSLQLRLISPQNPRALFFNEDVYVGYIPGGRIEIVSVDPDLGAIFYIFDVPRGGGVPRIERSDRCMNCHAREDTGFVPGLSVKSVIPGPGGGGLKAFRRGVTGHGIPLTERFAGWYVTGRLDVPEHWGNVVGRFSDGKLLRTPVTPGALFDFSRYPVGTSDVLPQLLHEHQAGFVNRAVEATYRARVLENAPSAEAARVLDDRARQLTRYLLFADEAALPANGIDGDAAFRTDFAKTRRAAPDGTSLKDLDLKTRLLKYRCSYMIYSAAFTGLPAAIKQRVFARMRQALDVERPDPEFAAIPAAEKVAIRKILLATLPERPAGW